MGAAPILIVGAGIAGYTLARALRRRDATIPIGLLAAHDGDVYPKSALPYAMGANRRPVELVQATTRMMQDRLGITIHQHSPAHSIDIGASEVVLKTSRLPFGQLALALGAELPKPRLAGDAASRVLTVNRLSDYAYLHHQLQGVRSLVLIGASVPACEFANDLVSSGYTVTMVDPAPYPLADRIPTLAGQRLMARLAHAGVRMLMDDRVVQIDSRGDSGFVIRTAGGSELDADMVFAAPIPQARTELAAAAGIKVGKDGIRVSDRLLTSTSGIYALGACAALPGPIHAASVDAQAEALAATLLGTPTRPDPRPIPLRLNTPACAMVLMAPPHVPGEWHENANKRGVTALFHDMRGQLRGFVLEGGAVDSRDRWLAKLTIA